MGARQSVPHGRTKTYVASGYVTPSVGSGASSEPRWLSTQPSQNAVGGIVAYPGPVMRAAPISRSPAPGIGSVPSSYHRPAPLPPTSHRPAPPPPPPALTHLPQHPSLLASQHHPMTTQPVSSSNIFQNADGARTVNGFGIPPVGSENAALLAPGTAAATAARDGDSGLLEALQAIALASQLSLFTDLKCTVCHKTIPADNVELHLLTCLTKPQIIYNEDVLMVDKGECTICFDELQKGHTIARLPCLCVYHKSCIDDWFAVSRCCPEHPDN